MARKITSKRIKGDDYGTIQRGASFTIPVQLKDEEDNPLDLTGYSVEFTVKKVKTDFDRHDDFAYITKSFLPQDPVNGTFYVMLSSDDTDFEPGEFYFDIELVHDENGMVFRLVTLSFTLDGGPTNRRVNKGMGQLPTGETITVITLAEGDPIIVIAPTMNLDGDVFGQLATLMESVQSAEDHVEECEELWAQADEKIKELYEQLAELQAVQGDHGDEIEKLKELIDLHHVLWHRQKDINENNLKTFERQGNLIYQQGIQISELEKRIACNEIAIKRLQLYHGRVGD